MLRAAWQRFLGYGFNRLYVAGGRFTVYDQSGYIERHATPEQRATGFNWTLYQLMASDRPRVEAYRRDIDDLVPGRSVLEIGPGPKAVLTSLAAAAGAESILTIEANQWVASAARRRLRPYGDRIRLLAEHSDELSDADLAAPRHFDVLLMECYHPIASQERVVETIASLRRRGLTFGSVTSRGFTTFVAPAAAPRSASMTVAERVFMGWPPGRRAADAAMAERWSSLHGDLTAARSYQIAPPQEWQWCDFEGDGQLGTAATLRFEVDRIEDFVGLQFFNTFEFHTGRLDTGRVATHWGIYFIPMPLHPGSPGPSGPAELVLTTVSTDPDRPSYVELTVSADGCEPTTLRL